MRMRFVAIREDMPGRDWLAQFVEGRAEADAWYRGNGRAAPPTAAECAAQLQPHMPELSAVHAKHDDAVMICRQWPDRRARACRAYARALPGLPWLLRRVAHGAA